MSRYTHIDLNGALVAITGAARGIGLATAKAFVDAGAVVAMGDLDGELVAAEAKSFARRGSGHQLDVRDKASFRSFVAAAEEEHGRPIDVLVNNAGVMPNGAFLDQQDYVDHLTMDVNLFGVVHGMRLVLPGMVQRGCGHVVNVASLAGKFPIKGLAMYNASKFAVVGLTAATRLELEETGVSVTTVLPSAVRTELSSGIDYGLLPAVGPEDVAQAVVESVHTRAAEVSVPSFVGVAAKAAPWVPEAVMRVVRRLGKDDAAITRVDQKVRQAYFDRIL